VARFHCFRVSQRDMKAPMKMGRKSCIFSAGGVATLHEGFILLLVSPRRVSRAEIPLYLSPK